MVRSTRAGSIHFRFGFAAIELADDIGANAPERLLVGLGFLAFAVSAFVCGTDEAALDKHREHLAALVNDLAAERDRMGPRQSETLAGRAEILAAIVSGRHEFTGDRETYDDLANANLISVIERRRGLPVALPRDSQAIASVL